MKEELLALNPRVAPESVKITGAPQFDFHLQPGLLEPREVYMKRMGLDSSRPYLLIGTGTAVWFPNEPPQISQLIEAILKRFPSHQILLRLHPKDDGTRWKQYPSLFEKRGVIFQNTAPRLHMDLGGFVPPAEFYQEQINAISHAAVVLNTASTLTVDASILDRPVISLGYDAAPDERFPEGRAWIYNQSNHFGTLVETGGVTVARSLELCLEAIQKYMENPSLHREGRRKIVEKVTGQVDGKAGERLAREVLKLAEGKRGPF